MDKYIVLLFTSFITGLSFSQKSSYAELLLSPELKENANSIVVESDTDITVANQRSVIVKSKKKVLVFNEAGLKNVDAIVYYDKSKRVKKIEAKLLDLQGKEVKSFKSKDFKDQSVADGFSIFTDNRMIYLDYTATHYPFVIEFFCETESENTAILPSWYPIDDMNESVISSKYSLTYPETLGFRYKEVNFEGYKVVKVEQNNKISFSLETVPAVKYEDYAPGFQNFIPHADFALTKFNLEGVLGEAKDWNEFGKWINNNLLQDQDELPETTKNAMRTLVGTETDPLKKARIVYEYVQGKTRYISVQMGIGGWKPMPAKDVDRLGYGDCKALSNYTMSLLKAVNVPSYYTIIYGGSQRRNLSEDFVSLQGNHVVLALPVANEMYFLECTSQKAPFGFEGNFTDGRHALVVKPEGGEIVKTTSYTNQLNAQHTKATYTLGSNGALEAHLSIVSKGIQYNDNYPLEGLSKDKIIEYYKRKFDVLKGMEIGKYEFENDKNNLLFKEQLELKSVDFADVSGDRLIFPLNAFNQLSTIPQRYRNRKLPFQVERGFFDSEEYTIRLPHKYQIESLPVNVELHEIFGDYSFSVERKNENELLFKRTLLLKDGMYEKEKYESFRKFKEQIAKLENSKIVVIKQ